MVRTQESWTTEPSENDKFSPLFSASYNNAYYLPWVLIQTWKKCSQRPLWHEKGKIPRTVVIYSWRSMWKMVDMCLIQFQIINIFFSILYLILLALSISTNVNFVNYSQWALLFCPSAVFLVLAITGMKQSDSSTTVASLFSPAAMSLQLQLQSVAPHSLHLVTPVNLLPHSYVPSQHAPPPCPPSWGLSHHPPTLPFCTRHPISFHFTHFAAIAPPGQTPLSQASTDSSFSSFPNSVPSSSTSSFISYGQCMDVWHIGEDR